MKVLALALLLVGCHPQVVLQVTPPNQDQIRWQREITDAVNAHDARIKKLEENHVERAQ